MPESQMGASKPIVDPIPRGRLKPFELAAFEHSPSGAKHCTIHVHALAVGTALRAAFDTYCIWRGWPEDTPYRLEHGGHKLVAIVGGETITIIPAQYATAKALKMGYTNTGVVLPRDLNMAPVAEVAA
ncbi:MAG: hypothetical protein AAGJ10_13810 [Bacteroidota bacterium]